MIKITIKRPNKNNPQIREYCLAVKKGQRSQHVVKASNGWAVKRIGARPSGVFSTQEKAINRAKNIAKKSKSEVFIHSKNGTIRGRVSFD